MRFAYVVSLMLDGRRAVVVGGGPVALERVGDLRDAGAHVVVVTPAPHDDVVLRAATDDHVELHVRGWQHGDLTDAAIAIATREDELDVDGFWQESRDRGVLASVLDDLPHCDFGATSLVRAGDLRIAIATAGRAPALAKRLRIHLEDTLGDAAGELVEVVAEAREIATPRTVSFPEWSRRWDAATADLDLLLDLVRAGRHDAARDHLLDHVHDEGSRVPAPVTASP